MHIPRRHGLAVMGPEKASNLLALEKEREMMTYGEGGNISGSHQRVEL